MNNEETTTTTATKIIADSEGNQWRVLEEHQEAVDRVELNQLLKNYQKQQNIIAELNHDIGKCVNSFIALTSLFSKKMDGKKKLNIMQKATIIVGFIQKPESLEDKFKPLREVLEKYTAPKNIENGEEKPEHPESETDTETDSPETTTGSSGN